jgi:hypothetical protein
MVETGVVNTVAMHVEIAFPAEVLYPGALGTRYHIQHGGREALMEKILLILLKPHLGLTGEIPVPISLPCRSGVDVPLLGLRLSVPVIPPFNHHERAPEIMTWEKSSYLHIIRLSMARRKRNKVIRIITKEELTIG